MDIFYELSYFVKIIHIFTDFAKGFSNFCMQLYTHTYIYIYIYTHTHTYIYIYIYTHTYIYIYIYIQTKILKMKIEKKLAKKVRIERYKLAIRRKEIRFASFHNSVKIRKSQNCEIKSHNNLFFIIYSAGFHSFFVLIYELYNFKAKLSVH